MNIPLITDRIRIIIPNMLLGLPSEMIFVPYEMKTGINMKAKVTEKERIEL